MATVKKLLNGLSKDQQEYYIFLAKECFSGFSNAEDNFNIYRYASCNAWLFHYMHYRQSTFLVHIDPFGRCQLHTVLLSDLRHYYYYFLDQLGF